jgi:hypothetical protein
VSFDLVGLAASDNTVMPIERHGSRILFQQIGFGHVMQIYGEGELDIGMAAVAVKRPQH